MFFLQFDDKSSFTTASFVNVILHSLPRSNDTAGEFVYNIHLPSIKQELIVTGSKLVGSRFLRP